jgi:hypothetical protein
MAMSWTSYKGLTVPDVSNGDAGQFLTANFEALADRTSGTVGSVVFVGATGYISQESNHLFWDDTNYGLTITTAALENFRRLELGHLFDQSFFPPLIKTVDLSSVSPDMIDEALIASSHLSNINTVIVRCHHLTVARTAFLALATSVSELFLSGSRISEEGFSGLTLLPKLKTLDLAETDFGDGHCKLLSRATTLVDLDVSNTRITDDGVRMVARLTSLTSLDISGTSTSPEVLMELTLLTSLVDLRASHTAINDETVEALAHLPQLESLVVQHTKVSNECVARLAVLRPTLLIVN